MKETIGIDLVEAMDDGTTSVIRSRPQRQRHGHMPVIYIDELDGKYCDLCQSVITALGNEYCIDCVYQKAREQYALLSALFFYSGDEYDKEFVAKQEKLMDLWEELQ